MNEGVDERQEKKEIGRVWEKRSEWRAKLGVEEEGRNGAKSEVSSEGFDNARRD